MFDIRIVDFGMTSKGGRQTAYLKQLNMLMFDWHVKRILADIILSILIMSILLTSQRVFAFINYGLVRPCGVRQFDQRSLYGKPSHFPNHSCLIAKWASRNIYLWILGKNSNIFRQWNSFKFFFALYRPFHQDHNVPNKIWKIWYFYRIWGHTYRLLRTTYHDCWWSGSLLPS